MKKVAVTLLIISLCKISFGQLTDEQRIQDSVIGWWSNDRFDNKIKPTTDPVQKKRVDITNLFVDWMKKSYTPVGGLGTVTRINNSVSFGVKFLVWNVSHDKEWTDEKGHFKPIPEENTPFGLWCNIIPASYGVPFLNGNGSHYFTWPADGYGSTAKDKKDLDLKKFPAISKYITRSNESQIVILAPGNKLPFVEVTIGEYLDGAMANIDRELQKKKDDILDANRGDDDATVKRRESFYAYQDKEFDRFRNGIRKWRDVYKDHLNEPALVNHLQPTINDFYGDTDPFKKSISDPVYPVYKVPKDIMEKCKTDKPQWIAAFCFYENKENGNQLYEMYRSMTENLNYDYIYNYFFDPEKVKGIPYKPANEEQLNARLNEYRKKNSASIQPVVNPAAATSGAFFFDDFSSSNEGREPANWYYYKAGCKPYTVKTLKGEKGKWLQLGYGRSIKPSLLKTIPTNFKMDFDLATDGNFTGRTGGAAVLTLTSNKLQTNNDIGMGTTAKGATITLRIESGNEADYNNNNYRGILRVDISNTPELNEENYSKGIRAEYPLTQFTDKKTAVHITLQVQNGSVTVMVNNKTVIEAKDFKMTYGGKCKICGVDPSVQFINLLLGNGTTDSDNIGIYAGNIKITKE